MMVVSCWREAFFRTPGRRFLCLMSPLDYDDLCPLTIRPTPAERVRVGILWTEFSADDQEMRPSDSLDVPAG